MARIAVSTSNDDSVITQYIRSYAPFLEIMFFLSMMDGGMLPLRDLSHRRALFQSFCMNVSVRDMGREVLRPEVSAL